MCTSDAIDWVTVVLKGKHPAYINPAQTIVNDVSLRIPPSLEFNEYVGDGGGGVTVEHIMNIC